MRKRDVALGAACKESGVGEEIKPTSLEERVEILEEKLDLIVRMLTANGINERVETPEQNLDAAAEEEAEINKDGIPIDLNLIGSSKGQVYVLTVRPDAYYIGHKPYKSLSAAATDVRGSRVSGWVFWKLPDGRTAKEVFNRS